jgi:hypothetical protein
MEVNQVVIAAFGPAAGRLVYFTGKYSDRNRNGNFGRSLLYRLVVIVVVLPVNLGRRIPGICKPINGNIIQHFIFG